MLLYWDKGSVQMKKWIAAVSGAIGTIVSYSVDGLGMAVTVLIGFMAIDYLTGIMGVSLIKI